MPEPMAPNPAAWMAALHTALAEIPANATLTVLAHSLGAINWIHHAAMSQDAGFVRPGPKADRVLLVAPPYVIREIPPLDAPPGAADFFPPPLSKSGIAALANETVLIASDTDDYSTYDQSSAYADGLGIDIQKLPGGGHISPYYGYGEWPWVLDWALRRANLPPLPNK
jgi:predicted alpha/beta hydrolase family esterase